MMRSKFVRRLLGLLALVGLSMPLVACMGPDPTSIRLLKPDAARVVYIDGTNQAGDKGDRALVEKKPSGMWVIPRNAEYRPTSQGEFTVGIILDPTRGYLIKNMNGVQVGRDGDDCLADDEMYVFPADATVAAAMAAAFEPTDGPEDTSNDDCIVPVGGGA